MLIPEVAMAADLPLFPQDDGIALGRILTSLATKPEEVVRIAAPGQEVALRDFGFEPTPRRRHAWPKRELR